MQAHAAAAAAMANVHKVSGRGHFSQISSFWTLAIHFFPMSEGQPHENENHSSQPP